MDNTYVYKNTGKETLTFMNVGIVEPGKTIESLVELNHPDVKLVTTAKANDDGATDAAPTANKQDSEESAA